MRHTARTPRARLICLFLCLLLPAQPVLSASAGAAARPGANNVSTPPGGAATPQGRAEAEAADLPDLNEARARPRFEPKAVPPVPSTRRRCPPHNPRCDEGSKGVVQPTPAPSPARAAAYGVGSLPQLADLAMWSLASLASAALGGAAPAFELPELDYYRGGGYSHTDAAPPSSYYEPAQESAATATLVDDLDDWSKSYSHTRNLTLDTSQPSALGGDTSRAARTAGTGEEIVWRKAKITSFRAVAYSCCGRPISFSFYTLTDGVSWTAVTPAVSSESLGGWTRYTYTLSGLPEVSYVKVRWGYAGEEAWTPQLGQVTIGYVAPQTFVDDLDDWSKTYSHSPDLGLDTGQAASAFYGDTSRAYRGSQAAGEVVWYRPGATSFQAVVYGVGGAAFSGMSFYTSADGARWSAAQAVLSSDPPGSWTRYTYGIADLRGAAYVKAAWNYAGEPLWTPQLGRVTITYVPPPPPQTEVDDLNDWSKTYSHTSNLFLDTSQASTIGGDSSRVARSAAGGEEIVWRKSGITSFRAVTYSCCGRPQSFGFYTSRDGASWSPAAAAMTSEPLGGWTRYTYSLTDLPEVGYVKVRWGYAGEEAWTPQLGQVTIGYVPPPPPQTLVDELDDWSKASGHTQNLFLDTSQAASFGGDSSRAARNVGGGEEVVWYRPGTTSFEAVVYSCCGRPFSFGFYTSRDGASWSSAAATLSAGQSLGGWTKYTYTSAGLPEVGYLKVRWGYAGEEAWTPQLGRVSITYTPASGAAAAGCWKEAGQFVRDFYQGALARQPGAAELQHWTSALAQAQGEEQLTAEAQGMGLSLFTSSEYAARARGDREYVADLYWAYLQRPPEQAGWDFWSNQIEACGADQQCRTARRADVRGAFEQSDEFRDGVRRLCGTSVTSGGGAGYNFSTARLEPSNRTGSGGADPLSRDYNWSLPILSLPGRAGLDLGLTLSYNSLVWTKDRDAGAVTFDADRGFPSPGFRLGFPTIQPKFYNPVTKRYAYLLLSPSGSRVELRQTDAAGVYESADSSYVQLTEAGGGLVLRATDGTALSFYAAGGAYECAEVKDANGNYVSIYRWADGRIDRVVDTLGRTINFTYDANGNLQEVWQTWTRETEAGAVTERHTWATFGFGAALTLQPLFSGLTVVGEQPGAEVPVLRQVGLADGSYYGFEYNGWGQVWKVTHYAADAVDAQGQPNNSHALDSTRLNLPGSDLTGAAPQTDCPRFTEERVWVEKGLSNADGEVLTSYGTWGPDMASCEVILPDRTTKRVSTYATSADGWKKGLTTSEEVISGGRSVRTRTLAWEHDGAGDAAYATNPRVTQASVSDPQGHTRTTRVTYTVPADFQGESGYTGTLNLRLPRKVEECGDGNCSAVLRTAVTDYRVANLGQYVQRRILGLARYEYLYEGAESPANLRSKLGYVYDEPNDSEDVFLSAPPSPAAQHDGGNYGPGFARRGNANRVRRYSVDQQTGVVGGYVESRVGYNVTGTVAYAKDPSGHKTSFVYADAFYQDVNRTSPDPQYQLKTYAYPTAVTDPDGFTSSTWYNYDMGVVSKSETPKPDVMDDQPGPEVTRLYDTAGRLLRVTNSFNAARMRWVYQAKMDVVRTYTLLEVGVEAQSFQVLDGVGRVRATAHTLPGSQGGYSGQVIDYDSMGRVVRQSNPAETNASGGSWTVTGDDAPANGGAGWVYTEVGYDWKGRPLLITNPGSPVTTKEFIYGGCGCAGGEAVSTRDEVGRRQRATYDPLGRLTKTETFSQQDKNSVFTIGPNEAAYSTTVNSYTVRDQLKRVRVYQGTDTSSVFQDTTMTYDGHGRLQSRHVPEQDADRNTVYLYNADDTVQSITDGRGARADYGYGNNRHLPTSVSYNLAGLVPGQNVPQTTGATYTYDAAGNRKSMADGSGGTTYQYDQLSRMTSESRTISGVGTFNLAYGYNLDGQLTSLTDPDGRTVNYNYNSAGLLSSVTGTGYNVSQLAANIQYRAWGALKHYDSDYNLVTSVNYSYDARMRPTHFEVLGNQTAGGRFQWMNANYTYFADGRIKFAEDDRFRDGWEIHHEFDRAYEYDDIGRLTRASTDAAARGGSSTGGPYQETFQYDVWGHMKERNGVVWNEPTLNFNANYVNNRNQGWAFPWLYDADGNATRDENGTNTYDAQGRKVTFTTLMLYVPFGSWNPNPAWNPGTVQIAYDGDGRVIKEEDTSGSYHKNMYYLPSTVLGGKHIKSIVSEWDDHTPSQVQTKQRVSIYANGERLAGSVNGSVGFEFTDPVTGHRQWGVGVGSTEGGEVQAEPLGQEVSPEPPPDPSSEGGVGGYPEPREYGSAEDPSLGCTLDGLVISCSDLNRFMRVDALALRSQYRDGDRLRDTQSPIIHLGLGIYDVYEPEMKDGEWVMNRYIFVPPDTSYFETTGECHIEVNFGGNIKPGTPSLQSGPDHRRLGESVSTIKLGSETYTHYGFRFEVRGWVNSGSIGYVGKLSTGNGGAWTIGQSKYTFKETNYNGWHPPGLGSWSDDSPKFLKGKTQYAPTVAVNGRNFAWSDEPGFGSSPDDPLRSGEHTTNFAVYAKRGNEVECEVRFHLHMTYANGTWNATIGRGWLQP